MHKSKFYFLTFVGIILSAVLNLTNAQTFLKSDGKKIVNGYGVEFHLKGIGLGGWLVQEGYMLHTAGFANSPSEIKKKIVDLIGTDNANKFYDAYLQYYVSRKDIEQIAKWGFNSIRIPLHYDLFTPKDQPHVYIDKGFNIVDSLLSWCKDNQLYLILDLHCAPGGQNKDNISDYSGYPALWEDTVNQDRTVELWKKLAERYANEPWIGGYDLLNETAWNFNNNNQPLRDLYIRITNAIRQVDNNHIIFIEGNWYATDFAGLTPPWDSNMAYSFHKYWNGTTQSSIQYLVDLRNNYNVPLWLGETGENSNAWFTDCVKLMGANDIGWAWWPHKKLESIAGPLSAKITPEYQQVLNYWSGSGSKPSVTDATNALVGEAYQLSIDRCTFHPDVIDAIIRAPGSDISVPYTNNEIPGTIFATDYDMGNNGIAYKDNDYQNTGGQGSGSWNTGGLYRNDGVDIETCNDFPNNGYDVGWIETGEWLNYTVNIKNEGNYDLTVRMASAQSGGKILFRIDNNNITDFIDMPNTGGWKIWQDVNVKNITLPAGKHVLTMLFAFGGFNVNYLDFTSSTVGTIETSNVPKSYSLAQNFPNPFNPVTTIKYELPKESKVVLKLYDMLGNEVKTLVNQEQSAGGYSVNLNAADLSSGVYLYRIQADEYINQKKLVLLK